MIQKLEKEDGHEPFWWPAKHPYLAPYEATWFMKGVTDVTCQPNDQSKDPYLFLVFQNTIIPSAWCAASSFYLSRYIN